MFASCTSTNMSANGSATDLPAAMAGLGVSRKKRPQRAFHNTFQPQTPQFPPAFAPPSSPGAFSASGYFTPPTSQPPVFGSPLAFASSAPPTPGAPTTLHVLNPTAMAHEPAPIELALNAARSELQREYASGVDGGRLFLSFQNIVPPPAGTQYHAVDQGTATPKHMRSTMYNVPELESLRRATRLPLAVTVRPFAPLLATEAPVPVVDMSELGEAASSDPFDVGPPRCNRCRTYINPLMMHTSTGKFTCNVCQFPNNTVPPEYVCMLDPMTGQRLDRDARPELHRGVYDIVVPKYYNCGGADVPAQGLHHVFLVDVSDRSVRKQLPVLVADAIRASVFDYNNEYDRPVKFALILFDKSMHFYNLAASLDTAQVSVSGDLDDPFVPFHDGLFADPEESRTVIEDALNNLELHGTDNVLCDAEPCFSVAVRTAALCLETVGGGKITAILSTLPSWGPGGSKIKENRNVGRNPLAEAEKRLYSPDNEYYKILAKDLIAQNVGLDVFAVSETSVDLSNIGWLASVTGGNVIKWTDFVFERDGRSLSSQIVSSVRKCTGYQGQLKLRCSNGLQVSQYYGFPTGSDAGIVGLTNPALSDPVIPVLNEDQAFTILLEYDGMLNTKYDCHFQAALLYTDPHGVRKVRVINLVLAVSERLHDVFSFVDQDAVVTAIVRDTLSFIGKELISELRNSVNEKLVDIFTHYRLMSEKEHNRNATMTNQLIFPDSLKHLPVYLLSLVKSLALRDSTTLSVDSRVCDVYQMLYMPMDKLVYHLYPALVELHSLEDDDCMALPESSNPHGFIKVPQYKAVTANSLEHGVYILCNGTTIYVWVHPESNKLLLKDLFGEHVETVDDIDSLLDSFPELPTHISQRARNMVTFFHSSIIGSSSINNLAIRVVREGIDSLTTAFKECLVEDNLPSRSVNTAPNLVEYLSTLHKAVKVKLESDKPSRKEVAGILNDTLAQRMIHF